MQNVLLRTYLLGALIVILVIVATSALGQEKITIQANARGTSTQLGNLVPVKIMIDTISGPAEQKALIDAFAKSGHDGMVDALSHMPVKGRISIEGRLGNTVRYIRELPSKNGRRFRLVTDRNLAFGELHAGTRSADYSIGGAEITITADGKGSGTLLPACRLMVNKQKQIEIETFQNPWQLTNFLVHIGD